MKQVAEKNPVVQIVQKIPNNYCPCLYLSIGQTIRDIIRYIQKIYPEMHPFSCTDTHHDVTDLVNHGTLINTKRKYLENGT